MKIAIVGSGAIGLNYGAFLARAGHETRFLMRADFEAATRSGIRVLLPNDEIVIPDPLVHRTTASIGPCDLVIVALKATSNAELPELLRPLVGPETMLLTLQNGLGNDKLLAKLFPENRIFAGLCFVCLNRIAPAVARNFKEGSVSIAARTEDNSEDAKMLADLFRSAGVDTRFEPDLELSQWQKLVWNVPFNGLAVAAGGVPTDRIVGSPELLAEARALMDEVVAIAAAMGKRIEPNFVDAQIESTLAMGSYKPSSMIDFVEGRSVEVEAIWGEPMRQAKSLGVAAPKLEMLYALLKSICL